MSRGRGRGRGGGNNATRDAFNAAFAGMSKEDSRAVFESFSRPTKGSGMMYPPLEKAAELPGPTALEESIVKHTIALARDMSEGQAGEHGKRDGAPWRLASERKVVGVEIESYSDRYRRHNQGANGPTTLAAKTLHLNQSLFPPALWSEYFDGVSNDGRASEAARARKRRKVLDGDDDNEEEEDNEDEDVDDDFDFSEASDDHQDYDHNYFDNGEGDDDSAGEGGEDDGGRYDD